MHSKPAQRPEPDSRLNDAQLRRRIDALESQNNALHAQAAAMRQSTSWRVTAPLRWLGVHVQRAMRASGLSRHRNKPRDNYADWVAAYDTPAPGVLSALRESVAAWRSPLGMSVLMRCRDADARRLREAIESVRVQVYAAWELCIAVDASTGDEIIALLRQQAASDARIRVEFDATLAGALALSTGDWIVLLGQDDLLAPHALYSIAREIAKHAEARMIYSDEDEIDGEHHRSAPCFKPDWNADLFLSRNIFSRLGAFQRRLVDEAGGFREGFEGAQDYDLALRCVEQVQGDQIRHVPRVLCHARAQSPAKAREAEANAVRALNAHFERAGIDATASAVPEGYRVRYALPTPTPRVSIIVPTRNAEALVRQCIESIVRKTAYPNFEILLVDNGSDDPKALAYFASLAERPGIEVIRDDRPFNYSALNNGAVRRARGELVALVNNDIEVVSPDWLDEMVSIALQPGVGAVGAKLLFPEGTLQHGGVLLGVKGIAGHAHRNLDRRESGYCGRARLTQSYSALTGACLVVRKSLYKQIGGLEEQSLSVAFNDVDFCLRLREAGYRNVWTPYAELIHHESATRGYEIAPEARKRLDREAAYMEWRWGDILTSDPAYNPNLTLEHEDFGLAWPPRVAPLDAALRVQAGEGRP